MKKKVLVFAVLTLLAGATTITLFEMNKQIEPVSADQVTVACISSGFCRIKDDEGNHFFFYKPVKVDVPSLPTE